MAGRLSRPWVLGISASHNGAHCLLHGDEIRVAIQEERLTGLKRARVYGSRRALGLRYCLDAAGIRVSDLAMVVLSCQRSARAEENDFRIHPDLVGLPASRRRIVGHHLAHAASAVATSGYQRAAVMVVDGQGSPVEDLEKDARRVIVGPKRAASEHLSLYHYRQGRIVPLEVHTAERWLADDGPGMARFFSLGGMYSAVAKQIFGDRMEAGKVMGLAPYGEAAIPMNEFLVCDGRVFEFVNRVQQRFGYDDRWPRRKRAYQDLAASAQKALETALLHTAARLRKETGESRLCMAGGVALNSVANERIYRESGFEDVYIAPWAEDSGVALGAAYLGLWGLQGQPAPKRIGVDSLGRRSGSPEIERALDATPGIVAAKPPDLLDQVVRRLQDGEIGGWYQDGCELGPRALGQRSIVCSPCGDGTKRRLNARVKFREPFRPFAPAVLSEFAEEWFQFDGASASSPFMLRVVSFKAERRAQVPAVVHVDCTGRLQTLTAAENPPFYELVHRFQAQTGVPMLLNTSFNVAGEPIVETPVDALWCLLGSGMNFCVIHDWLVTKARARRGILDYVPAVVAKEYTLRMNVKDGSLQSAITREDAVAIRVSTPWGAADTPLPLRLLPLLAKIDGKRTGRELCATLPEENSARDISKDLLLLRRMHIIEFTDPHAARH